MQISQNKFKEQKKGVTIVKVEELIEYLNTFYKKVERIVKRGSKVSEKIDDLILNSALEKVDIDALRSQITNRRVLKRRYGTTQAAEMANISHALIYAAERDGRLPAPIMREDTKKATRAGYTINDINKMRVLFGTAPRKPHKSRAPILGYLNLKGGSQKTTHCHLMAQFLALKGYRVLVVDTDPQGSLSLLFGLRPDIEVVYEKTIAPFLLEDDDALVQAGHDEGASETLNYAIQKTYWDNIDIIPSCLDNLNIDFEMPLIIQDSDSNPVDYIARLGDGIRGVADHYDFVLLDGTPSLNFSTMNVISACDMVFVPTPAAYADYESTLSFTKLVQDLVDTYLKNECYPNVPDVRFFIAKFSNANSSHFWSTIIRKVFNEPGLKDVLDNESYHTDEISKASTEGNSIYEVTPSEADNRKRLKKDTEMFNRLFQEMHDVVWDTFFEEAQPQADFIDKVDDIHFRADRVEEELKKVIGED